MISHHKLVSKVNAMSHLLCIELGLSHLLRSIPRTPGNVQSMYAGGTYPQDSWGVSGPSEIDSETSLRAPLAFKLTFYPSSPNMPLSIADEMRAANGKVVSYGVTHLCLNPSSRVYRP